MKKIMVLVVGLLQTALVMSQASLEQQAKPVHIKTIQDAFQHGHFDGNFRTFAMATDNTRQLTDYYAWAAGGGLRFNTAAWHGFSTGIGGSFNFNLASSDFSKKDPLTGAVNRYEIGLFDVTDVQNRNNLDRLEELWLRYTWKNTRLTLGHQQIQTPFINPQDGRMRPTVVSGLWGSAHLFKNTNLEGGWLWKISPRSTVAWYGIGESIGLYPKGLNPDGTGSGYATNLKSAGIGVLGLTHTLGKNVKIQAWDHYITNIFNTALIQADASLPLQHGHTLLFGAQFTHQDALANGGNAEADKSYFTKGGQSNVISVQSGWKRKDWQVLAAYTRVTGDGRFLSPREWGREPFYTFMSRERVEGSGDSRSVTGRVSWQNADQHFRVEAAYGHFYLPDVQNTALNKYAFPAYRQFNANIKYTFGGVFTGLKMEFLYVWKGRMGDVYGKDKYVINRVNMSNYNLIFNYYY